MSYVNQNESGSEEKKEINESIKENETNISESIIIKMQKLLLKQQYECDQLINKQKKEREEFFHKNIEQIQIKTNYKEIQNLIEKFEGLISQSDNLKRIFELKDDESRDFERISVDSKDEKTSVGSNYEKVYSGDETKNS